MLKNNWDKIKYLPISSFVLVSIVFVLVLYLTLKIYFNLKQIQKFKKQEVIYYENHRQFIFLVSGILIMITFYCLNLIFFILYLIWINQDWSTWQGVNYFFLEFLALFFLIGAIYLLLWTNQRTNSIALVVKNQKLILLDETILLDDIIRVYHDPKRKYFYLNWKDSKTKGNTEQMKIRYHYEIKDLFLSLQLPTDFD